MKLEQWEWYCLNCHMMLRGEDIFYDKVDNVHCASCGRVVQLCGRTKEVPSEQEPEAAS